MGSCVLARDVPAEGVDPTPRVLCLCECTCQAGHRSFGLFLAQSEFWQNYIARKYHSGRLPGRHGPGESSLERGTSVSLQLLIELRGGGSASERVIGKHTERRSYRPLEIYWAKFTGPNYLGQILLGLIC